jgi:ABC-type branched-subunit amino acid transport system substrate-binding protein
MEDAHHGYKLFADLLDQNGRAFLLKDAQGQQHRLKFDYLRYDDDCDAAVHEAAVKAMISDDKVHFMFGSTPVFAEAESTIANDAERLMYHCW